MTFRTPLALLALLLTALSAGTAQNPPPAYLAGMPEPARVIDDIRGSDSLDTFARQRAALFLLCDVVETISQKAPGGSWLFEQERALNGRYVNAYGRIYMAAYHILDPTNVGLSDPQSPRNQWNRRFQAYWSDEGFRREVLDQYVPAGARTSYVEIYRERVAQNRLRADSQNAREARARRDSAAADSAARESAVRAAPPAAQGTPVPPDQRRFALAVNDWCRRFLAPQLTNPIAREQFQHEASRQAAAISRSVGPVQGWSGILLRMEPYLLASGATLVVSVDTAASISLSRDEDSLPPAAVVKAGVGPNSPIYAAAGRMRIGQRVIFSGRTLQYDDSEFWLPFRGMAGGRHPRSGEPLGCEAPFKIVLTALRPAP